MKNWLARLVLGSYDFNKYISDLIKNNNTSKVMELYSVNDLVKDVSVSFANQLSKIKEENETLKKDVSDLKKENYLLKSKIDDLEFVDNQTIRVQNNHDSMIYDTHKSLEYFLPKFEKVFLLVEQRSPFVDRLIREKDKKDYNEFKIKQFDQEIMKVLRGANEEK